jgi:putative ABC transport system permease protein
VKYMRLVFAALFRKKIRCLFTLLSIATAFLQFGLLDTVRVAFESGKNLDGAKRLIVTSRLSLQKPLPINLLDHIRSMAGVEDVAAASWFLGSYQNPNNPILNLAISDNYFDLYPEIVLSMDQRELFNRTRTGAVVGATLANKLGWKLGDTIPIKSTMAPFKGPGGTWTFKIVGIFHAKDIAHKGQEHQLFLHWKYFDDGNLFGSQGASWYVLNIKDVNNNTEISKAVDLFYSNSDHETKTQSEQAFQASFVKQLVNIGLIVTGIMGAVFFALMLLTGNVMMQGIRERNPDFAVLKTLGFTNSKILMLILCESVFLLLIGSAIGLALATIIIPVLIVNSGGLIPLHGMSQSTWVTGMALAAAIGVVVGLLPSIKALRLNVVNALAHR